MFIYSAVFLRTLPAWAAVFLLPRHHYILSGLLLAFSVVCDGIYGVLKKKFTCRDKVMLLHLEGLTDFLAYGVCPAMFCFFLAPQVTVGVVSFLFLCSGIFRISRFNCEGLQNGCYRGLPITYNGYIIPGAYLLIRGLGFESYLGGVFTVLLALVAILMVSPSLRVKEIG